jgi:selenide, water dikinase
VLDDILSKLPPSAKYPNLLVGVETGDDSAVFKINDEQAVVATTDFFMPIVDDPYDFGRISATNALSDIYAIGGQPIMALAIAGFPVNSMSDEDIAQVLAGGAAVCEAAGVPVAGGHTIDAKEPIYGLAVTGLIHPDKIKRNSDGRAGDVLILGKGLGVGILGAAMNKDELDPEGYKVMVESTTKLNSVGAELAALTEINALTDVTGFGLCGHMYEFCKGAGLSANIVWDQLPLLDTVLDYAQKGYNTGAAGRNWDSFVDYVVIPDGMEQWQKNLLMDPQTSGGLLASCPPEAVEKVLKTFHDAGFDHACVIGDLSAGDAKVTVT